MFRQVKLLLPKKQLDCHNAVKTSIPCLPHFAHSSGTYGGKDFVWAEFFSDHKGGTYWLEVNAIWDSRLLTILKSFLFIINKL